MPFSVICAVCEEPFTARHRGRMYCSKSCAMRSRAYVDPDRPRKRCPRCGEIKERAGFYANSTARDGMTSWCRLCTLEARKGTRLFARYGISQEEYAAMAAGQGGVCMVCGAAPSRTRSVVLPSGEQHHHRVLHVDHDHQTGRVRDLLCAGCNFFVGQLEANPDRVWAAVAYLSRHGVTVETPTRAS